jgi:hypothetical protein
MCHCAAYVGKCKGSVPEPIPGEDQQPGHAQG